MNNINRFCLLLSFWLLGDAASAQFDFQWSTHAVNKNVRGGIELSKDIDTDNDNNSYVIGTFTEVTDLDPGVDTAYVYNMSYKDTYLAKYDSTGAYIWGFALSGPNDVLGVGVEVDYAGNIIVTGNFSGTVDFDPLGAGNVLTSNSYNDLFLAKYDANGNFIWAEQITSTAYNYAIVYSITCDTLSNIYITGYFKNIVDFDPSIAINDLNGDGTKDIFVAKYSSNGDYVWAFEDGDYGTENNTGTYIEYADDNIYVIGDFKDSIDLDPSANIANLVTLTFGNVQFLAKYDLNGGYKWAKSFVTAIKYESLAVGPNTDICLAGEFSSTADFDPSPGTFSLTSYGGDDACFAKFDSSGVFLWAKHFGGTSTDRIKSVVIDQSNDIYFTGAFQSFANLDPLLLSPNISSNGNYDIFLSKYDPAGNYIWGFGFGSNLAESPTKVVCQQNQNPMVYGDFYQTVDFDPGASSTNTVATYSTDVYLAHYDQGGVYDWVDVIGGVNVPNSGDDKGVDIAMDDMGFVYVIGDFSDTMDFDGPGILPPLIPNSAAELFLAKYDTLGNCIWAKSIAGAYTPGGITIDGNNNLYISGRFSGSVDFDLNAGSYILNGNNTMFFAKYTINGDIIWAKNTTGTIKPYHMALDSALNLFLTGYANQTVNFDPLLVAPNISTTSGSLDIFLAKYDSLGNHIFGFTVPSTGTLDQGVGLAIDPFGNPVISGLLYGTGDFDPSTNVANLTVTNGPDSFLAKYDNNGNYIWARSIKGPSQNVAGDLAIDTFGNVYHTGRYMVSTDFYSTTGYQTLTSSTTSSNTNGYVVKYNPNGDVEWIRNINSSYNEAYGIAMDENNNAIVVGSTIGSMDVDLNGIVDVDGYGNYDGILFKYDQYGYLISYGAIGGTGIDQALGITTGTNNDVYVTGLFSALSDFDPSQDTSFLRTYYQKDMFVARYNSSELCNNSVFTANISACDSYLWPVNGVTYTTGGTYQVSDTTALGCDSIYVLNLSINSNTSNNQYTTACSSYTWPSTNQIYTTSGIYYDSLVSSTGCDSITTLFLTIGNPDTVVIDTAVCYYYYWSATGVTYSSSGVHNAVLTNASGCDSLVTLNLTIYPYFAMSVINNQPTLSAGTIGGLSYQWFDCGTMQPIPGETNSSFTTTYNGSFAIIYTNTITGCVDTTNCVTVNNVGLTEINEFDFSLYPNPADDYLIIQSDSELIGKNFVIREITGKIISTGKINGMESIVYIKDLSAGVYLFSVEDVGSSKRFVKQ